MRRASLALALLGLVPLAAAQANNLKLGVSVNAYYFVNGRLRDAFGDPAITYGANLAAITRPRSDRLTFAYDVISANKGDSTLFVVPFTAGYEKQFADRTAKLLPYARVEAGVAYYDVAVHTGDWDRSFKSFGAVGAVEAGVVFNKVLSLKAKYYLFQGRSGIDLTGGEIGLVYNFAGL